MNGSNLRHMMVPFAHSHHSFGKLLARRTMSGALASTTSWAERSRNLGVADFKRTAGWNDDSHSSTRLAFASSTMTLSQRTLSSSSSSPFASKTVSSGGDGSGVGKERTKKPNKKRKHDFVPRKAAVQLTEKARMFFKRLLDSNPQMAGVLLNYDQSSTGEPRMVFSFDFVKQEQLHPEDEGVSLEVLEDGSPKSPIYSQDDGLPKLYVHHNAFLKVLGAKVDVNLETIEPILYDRSGNTMDPNA